MVAMQPINPPNHIENGREYHGYRRGMYAYPCDETELHRMDVMHALFKEARGGKLHERPIIALDGPPRILDLGCGTGHWGIEMAEQYDHLQAEVLGIDLAVIQPPQIPRNFMLRVPLDYETPWRFGDDSFNLIHLRLGCGSVSNWAELYSNVFRHLKPQTGVFEQVEMDIEPRCDDGTMPKDAMIRQWYDELKRATLLAHRPIAYNHATREMLASQGFIDIQEKTVLIPLSTWPAVHTRQRDLANWYQMVLCKKDGFEGLEAYSLGPLTRPPCNWPKADVVGRCAQVDREIRNRKYHMYNNMHIITARRP